jgi:hypothetical protein
MVGWNDVYRWPAFEQGGKIFRAIGRRVHPDPAQPYRAVHAQAVSDQQRRPKLWRDASGFCDPSFGSIAELPALYDDKVAG